MLTFVVNVPLIFFWNPVSCQRPHFSFVTPINYLTEVIFFRFIDKYMEIEKSGTEKGRIFQAVEESLKLDLQQATKVQIFSNIFARKALHIPLFSVQMYLIEQPTWSFIAARIRRMGKVMFSVSLSVHQYFSRAVSRAERLRARIHQGSASIQSQHCDG